MASLFRRLGFSEPAALGSGGFARVLPDAKGRDRISRVVDEEDDAATVSGLEKLTRLRGSLLEDPALACPGRFLRLAGFAKRKGGREVMLEPLGIPFVDGRGKLAEAASPSDPALLVKKRRECAGDWKDARITPGALQRVLLDIALALLCQHLSGFAHGDLKPANVVLDCGQTELHAILIDYDTLMPLGLRCEAAPDAATTWDVSTPGYVSKARWDFLLRSRQGLVPGAPTYDAVEDDLHALSTTFAVVLSGWRRRSDPPERDVLRPILEKLLAAVTRRLTADSEGTRPGAPVDPRALRRLAVCRRWRQKLRRWSPGPKVEEPEEASDSFY